MRLFILMSVCFAVVLGTGCTTSRVVEDSRAPDIVIDRFGDVTFAGKRVEPDQIAKAVVDAKIPRTHQLRILVPEQRDHLLMRTITDNLRRAGYRMVFVTDKTATLDAKPLKKK